jgi:hypothetical protein
MQELPQALPLVHTLQQAMGSGAEYRPDELDTSGCAASVTFPRLPKAVASVMPNTAAQILKVVLIGAREIHTACGARNSNAECSSVPRRTINRARLAEARSERPRQRRHDPDTSDRETPCALVPEERDDAWAALAPRRRSRRA